MTEVEMRRELAEGSNKETENYMSAWLAWKDLTVTIPVKNKETHYVLEGITGYAEPGTFTALMGPSGSGKSTLLDALAGRLSASLVLSGTILLNGQKFRHSYGTIAYVTQQDDLIGTLTVRETITYSAQLRLPDKMSMEEKQALVEDAITEMGLQECADVVIGNWHLRGISGGEKRRLNIALEILMRPRLLFLDEPTSGLDSASAFFIIQTLWGLAREGRTVIASVHQPSSQIFESFDQLFLLSGGKTVFFGKASEANEFFAQSGFPCPCRRNPADHFLRNINSDFDKVNSNLKNVSKLDVASVIDPVDRFTAKETTQVLISHYKASKYSCAVKDKVHEISKIQGLVFQSEGSQASFLMQCFTLTKRSFVNMSRDLAYYWLRLIVFVAVSVGIGIIYFKVGTKYNSIMARGASAYFSIGFSAFMSIGGFPSFVEDMKVFRKERLNGYYGVATFIISNTFSAMPYLVMISFLSGTICYLMVHLHPGFSHYLFFILCFYATISTIESLMMAIASVVPNFLMGIVIGAGIQGIFMMVSGSIYFRLPHDIPKPFWRYPMMYTSLHYWAVQGLYQNDLRGLVFDNVTPELPKISGEHLLKTVFEIRMDRSKWLDLSAIFSMIIIYRILCFIMININEGLTPYLKAYVVRRRMQHKGSNIHENEKSN